MRLRPGRPISRAKTPQIPPYIINVHKPSETSSQDVVRRFKRNLPEGYGKIGHFGTLDPFASGVFLIGVAGATRLNDYVHSLFSKTYTARGYLGAWTETGDRTSEVYNDKIPENIKELDIKELDETFKKSFEGKYLQSPPAFSAAKHKGKALHQWAREGVVIEKPPVEREVFSLEVLSYDFPYLTFRVEVSSGTYIRVLFDDMAKTLGTRGYLEELRRDAIGPFTLQNSLEEKNWPEGKIFDWDKMSLRVDQALPFGVINLDEEKSISYGNGQPFSLDVVERLFHSSVARCQSYFWIYNVSGDLMGLGQEIDGIVKAAFNLSQCKNML